MRALSFNTCQLLLLLLNPIFAYVLFFPTEPMYDKRGERVYILKKYPNVTVVIIIVLLTHFLYERSGYFLRKIHRTIIIIFYLYPHCCMISILNEKLYYCLYDMKMESLSLLLNFAYAHNRYQRQNEKLPTSEKIFL